jgi:hypothetical protein
MFLQKSTAKPNHKATRRQRLTSLIGWSPSSSGEGTEGSRKLVPAPAEGPGAGQETGYYSDQTRSAPATGTKIIVIESRSNQNEVFRTDWSMDGTCTVYQKETSLKHLCLPEDGERVDYKYLEDSSL